MSQSSRPIFHLLHGVWAVFVVCFAMIIFALYPVIGGALTFLIPIHKWRNAARNHLNISSKLWGYCTRHALLLGMRQHWDIKLPDNLSEDQWYLLISNHQSWADILILLALFAGHSSSFKFFYKRELIWQLPFAGLAIWILRFPGIARHSREKLRKKPELKEKNMKQIEDACALLATAPCTTVNFIEGTRFKESKQQQQKSPYRHLLIPKSQGISMALNSLENKLTSIIDVDLCLPRNITLWQLLSGQYSTVYVHADLIPITSDLHGDFNQDRDYRRHLKEWVGQLWHEKDARLDSLRQDDHE